MVKQEKLDTFSTSNEVVLRSLAFQTRPYFTHEAARPAILELLLNFSEKAIQPGFEPTPSVLFTSGSGKLSEQPCYI